MLYMVDNGDDVAGFVQVISPQSTAGQLEAFQPCNVTWLVYRSIHDRSGYRTWQKAGNCIIHEYPWNSMNIHDRNTMETLMNPNPGSVIRGSDRCHDFHGEQLLRFPVTEARSAGPGSVQQGCDLMVEISSGDAIASTGPCWIRSEVPKFGFREIQVCSINHLG